jgi:COMPASS component SWD3
MKSTKPGVPFSYVTWRPDSNSFNTHNIFTTVNSDGEIQTWHLLSGKCLNTMKDDSKNTIDKQLNCVDYNNDGTKLAVCGSEKTVVLHV